MTRIESYYGKYSKQKKEYSPIKQEEIITTTGYPARKKSVLAYLKKNAPAYALDLVYGKLIQTVSSQYSHKPDVYDLKQVIDALEREGRFTERKNRINQDLSRNQLEEHTATELDAEEGFQMIREVISTAAADKNVRSEQ
jgi:hypothetical protein